MVFFPKQGKRKGKSWFVISHVRATHTFSLLGRGGEHPASSRVPVDPPRDDDAVVVVRDDLVRVDEDVGDGGGVLVQHPRRAIDVQPGY